MLELWLDNELFMFGSDENEIMTMYHWLIDLDRNVKLIIKK